MDCAPKVSVIAIFFNAAEFLAEALDSVFAQTFDDWELLLVDDGSSDGSSEIARNYVARRPARVRYLEHAGHANRGASAARNLGIRHAQGNYLALLDADDVWLPPKLEQQVAILDAHEEAALVYGVTKYWYGWTGQPADVAKDYSPAVGVPTNTVIAPPTLLTLCLESKAPTLGMSDILIRRSVVESVGGFEQEFTGSKQLFEDQAFLAKVYLQYPAYVSNRSWFYYRQHANSCVAAQAHLKYAVGLYYFDWLESYLRIQKVADAGLWKALAEKRWRYRHPRLSACQRYAQQRLDQVIETAKRTTRWILPPAAYRRLKEFTREHGFGTSNVRVDS